MFRSHITALAIYKKSTNLAGASGRQVCRSTTMICFRGSALLKKKRNRYYLALVSHETGFLRDSHQNLNSQNLNSQNWLSTGLELLDADNDEVRRDPKAEAWPALHQLLSTACGFRSDLNPA